MLKKTGIIYAVMGILLCIYGICLIVFSQMPLQMGVLTYTLMLTIDFLWYMILGSALFVTGVLIIWQRYHFGMLGTILGNLLIFSVVCFVFSFRFNLVADPYFQTYGRIITFSIQALSHLLNPSFSLSFFNPLSAILVIAFLSFCFNQYVKKMV